MPCKYLGHVLQLMQSILGVHSGLDLYTFGFGKDRKPQVLNVKLLLPEAPFLDIELGLEV